MKVISFKTISFLVVFLLSQNCFANAVAKLIAQRAGVIAAQAQRTTLAVRAERARKVYSVNQQARRAEATVLQTQQTRRTVQAEQTRKAYATLKQTQQYGVGKIPVRRPAPAIANDVYQRKKNGTINNFLNNKGEILAKNRISGKVGETRAYMDLKAAGFKVASQVTMKINGTKRVLDHVIQHPLTRKITSVEVKTGKAVRSLSQSTFDSNMARSGASFVGKNSGALAGSVAKLATVVFRL